MNHVLRLLNNLLIVSASILALTIASDSTTGHVAYEILSDHNKHDGNDSGSENATHHHGGHGVHVVHLQFEYVKQPLILTLFLVSVVLIKIGRSRRLSFFSNTIFITGYGCVRFLQIALKNLPKFLEVHSSSVVPLNQISQLRLISIKNAKYLRLASQQPVTSHNNCVILIIRYVYIFYVFIVRILPFTNMDQTVCKNSDSQCNLFENQAPQGSSGAFLPVCQIVALGQSYYPLPRPGVRPCYFRYGTPALLRWQE